MNSGRKRGNRIAPSSTQRYPATSACEVRASIDCAREMRGISSSENAVTPRSASACTPSSSLAGEANPTVIAPFGSVPIVSRSSGRTCASTSTFDSGMLAASSAPASA